MCSVFSGGRCGGEGLKQYGYNVRARGGYLMVMLDYKWESGTMLLNAST